MMARINRFVLETCNLVCADLLMNSDHKLKKRSVRPNLLGS